MSTQKTITAQEILQKTTAFFAGKGIESARLDAEVLLAEVLGYDRLHLYMNLDRPLDEAELGRARELVRRRGAREPVAYIIGRKEFAGRSFKVGPGVLVPRPDTEILVEEAAKELRGRFDVEGEFGNGEAPGSGNDAGRGEPEDSGETGELRVLEFGVGSGAIAVTLAAENLRVRVTGTEINEAAAAIARENAMAHGVNDRVEILVQADFTNIGGDFHGIVSNPPYIDATEKADLSADVVDYEPHEALFAEKNGLRWYEFLAGEAGRLLAPGGFIAVEIGYKQRVAVEEIMAGAGLRVVRTVKDYGGHDRVVVAEKAGV